jgi:predicted DNA-binding protein YlxM (UPF0122 family)
MPHELNSRRAPPGPLVGDELAWAIELLTDKQYLAYRYRREGHALNWIANRLGVSRPAVIHHIAKAEKRLGYAPTVTAKQKSRYKSAKERREAEKAAKIHEAAAALSEMTTAQRHRIIRRVFPDAPKKLDERTELRLLTKMLMEALDNNEARERMAKRLRTLEHRAIRERKKELQAQRAESIREFDGFTGRYLGDDDDWSRAVGEDEAEGAADLQELGVERAKDLVEDKGGGYDRM